MNWIEPTEKDPAAFTLEKRLWDAADQFRANFGLNRMLGIVMESEEYKQYIQTNIGGAAQSQANAVVLTSMRHVVPPSSVGEKFDRLVAPMIDEAELIAVKIQNLRRTRDLLLQRLLSGQLNLTVPTQQRT